MRRKEKRSKRKAPLIHYEILFAGVQQQSIKTKWNETMRDRSPYESAVDEQIQ